MGRLTKNHTTHRPKHQHQRNTPSDLRILLAKILRQFGDGKRDSEEVEGIPRPGQESNKEEHPLLEIEHSQQLEWIGRLVHRRLERRESRCGISPRRHPFGLWCLIARVSTAGVVEHLVAVVRHVGRSRDAL